MNNDGAAQLSFALGRDAERLRDDSDDDNDHAYEGETAGFGKLGGVSCGVALGGGACLPLQYLDITRVGMKCQG